MIDSVVNSIDELKDSLNRNSSFFIISEKLSTIFKQASIFTQQNKEKQIIVDKEIDQLPVEIGIFIFSLGIEDFLRLVTEYNRIYDQNKIFFLKNKI
ncbi:MAG: hypothetical protein JXR63_00225 [Spirochaetales bacterium]|nr:hypothetical protein [Spirochaetales bacterium]